LGKQVIGLYEDYIWFGDECGSVVDENE